MGEIDPLRDLLLGRTLSCESQDVLFVDAATFAASAAFVAFGIPGALAGRVKAEREVTSGYLSGLLEGLRFVLSEQAHLRDGSDRDDRQFTGHAPVYGHAARVCEPPNSWKVRHIAPHGKVAVTVPIRRGGPLSLVTSIPPATVTFHATATVHPADSPGIWAQAEAVLKVAPPERRASDLILEIIPEGTFLTYGVGVSLMMLDPNAAQGRVAVC